MSDSSRSGEVFRYFSVLTLFLSLSAPNQYLADISITFILKDQLHATAQQVSFFRLLIGTPLYFAFVFGFTRDRWNPLGLRDRGYFLMFAPAVAGAFAWMAWSRMTYSGLLTGMLLVMILSGFIGAAYSALLALVGQEQLMTGRLAVLWQFIGAGVNVAGAFAGGWIAENLKPSGTFLLLGGLTLLMALIALWHPRAVFGQLYDRPQARGAGFWNDVKRLVRHRAIYPAVLTTALFQFAPGSNTPLQYYLTNQLHTSDAVYGYFNGLFAAAFLPMYFLYGYLCQKVPLKKLLWWGTIITIPQNVPLAYIHSGASALWWAVPIGMMGGIAAAAYYDLLMRSCPAGLQGTLMALSAGAVELSFRGGDLLGVKIYQSSPAHGFQYCVIAISTVYALILPVLLLIPKDLIATSDGQASAAPG